MAIEMSVGLLLCRLLSDTGLDLPIGFEMNVEYHGHHLPPLSQCSFYLKIQMTNWIVSPFFKSNFPLFSDFFVCLLFFFL